MWIRVLGSAAGGGFPQWNCACPNCAGVRAGTLTARTRTQASIAVSLDRRRWFLVNATPDVNSQLNTLADDDSEGPVRRSPVEAVLLTDAELDHVAGLLSLREGTGIAVYATAWIHQASAPVVDVLAAYAPVDRRVLAAGEQVSLGDLYCRAIPTGSTKRPRYAADRPADPSAVVGYRFSRGPDRPALVYLPCVPVLTDELLAELAAADCVFVDGTCWTDDELARVGLSTKTSRCMGHAPVTGPGGTLDRLAGLPVARRVYTHLNNTNPLLVEDSAERHAVEALGIEVAYDGMEIELK